MLGRLVIAGLVLALLVPATADAQAASIKLSKAAGPPTTSLTVSGSGFFFDTSVVVRFDATQLATVPIISGSSSTHATIVIPASATPGSHVISATGVSSGDSASKPFLVQTDWPVERFDSQQSGWNPYENVITKANVSQVHQHWFKPIALADPSVQCTWFSSPVVSSGRVYVEADNLDNYAYDATTGSLKYDAKGGGEDCVPNEVAANSTRLASLWGSQYGNGADQRISIYASATGKAVAVNSLPFTNQFILSGGVIYAYGGDSLVGLPAEAYAIRASDGTVLWGKPLSAFDFTHQPVILGTTAYFADGTTLKALATGTGATRWSIPNGGTPVAADRFRSLIYTVNCATGSLCAYHATTHTLAWARPYSGPPAVASQQLYAVCGATSICGISPSNGAVAWTATASSGFQPPVVADGMVFTFTGAGKLDALDATTGTLVAALSPATPASTGGLPAPPIIANGLIYIAAADGLHAYGP